jgi:hypothetical protein
MATPVSCPQQREDGFTCFGGGPRPQLGYLCQLVPELDESVCAPVCALGISIFITSLIFRWVTNRWVMVRIHPPPPVFFPKRKENCPP